MTVTRTEQAAWIIGGIGIVGAAISWIIAPAAFAHAWLAAFIGWIGWPLGSIGLLLIHALTGGRWGRAIQLPLVLGISTLPLLLPAVVPLLLELHALYPWARPEIAKDLGNVAYLNVPFFYGRGVLYLVLWLGLGALALRALGSASPTAALRRLAPVGLMVLMLTVTFGGFDAVLSLDPHFNSSIFGMIAATEATLFALSLAILLALILAPPSTNALADLAKLLLGLVIFWGYLVFMELLIVWNSDLGNDAPWFVIRTERGWGMVAGFVFIFHFLLPFLMLLWPGVQRSRRAMSVVTGMIIVAELPRVCWLAVPGQGRLLSWIDACALLALGGLTAGVAMRAQHLPLTRRAMQHA